MIIAEPPMTTVEDRINAYAHDNELILCSNAFKNVGVGQKVLGDINGFKIIFSNAPRPAALLKLEQNVEGAIIF